MRRKFQVFGGVLALGAMSLVGRLEGEPAAAAGPIFDRDDLSGEWAGISEHA